MKLNRLLSESKKDMLELQQRVIDDFDAHDIDADVRVDSVILDIESTVQHNAVTCVLITIKDTDEPIIIRPVDENYIELFDDHEWHKQQYSTWIKIFKALLNVNAVAQVMNRGHK